MIKIGLKKGEQREFNNLLTRAHTLSVRCRLLDLNHNYLKDLSDYVIDGQVSVDASASITRACDLTLFDPLGKIDIDPDSPGRASVFIADMISIVLVIGEPDRSKHYSIPVFCGPIDLVNRDDMFLVVKCLGKESLSVANLWKGKIFKKGQNKVNVIEAIFRTLMGETRMNLKKSKAKLANNQKLSRANAPWTVAKKLASSMGFRLFYDGRGIAQLRRKVKNPVVTFDESWVTSKPTMAYDLKGTINAVDVIGHKPKKSKKPVRGRAIAPRPHPLSPWRLGRGNVPRYLWLEIKDDSIESKKEAMRVAKENLKRGLMTPVQVKFDGIPHPQLEELDPARVNAGMVNTKAVMSQFTIPLVAGEDSTYGYLRRRRPKGGAPMIKARKKKGKGDNWSNEGRGNGPRNDNWQGAL